MTGSLPCTAEIGTLSINCFFFRAALAAYGSSNQRLGVQSELRLLAYTTATATSYPSLICNLNHSSQQCQILIPDLAQWDKDLALP